MSSLTASFKDAVCEVLPDVTILPAFITAAVRTVHLVLRSPWTAGQTAPWNDSLSLSQAASWVYLQLAGFSILHGDISEWPVQPATDDCMTVSHAVYFFQLQKCRLDHQSGVQNYTWAKNCYMSTVGSDIGLGQPS